MRIFKSVAHTRTALGHPVHGCNDGTVCICCFKYTDSFAPDWCMAAVIGQFTFVHLSTLTAVDWCMAAKIGQFASVYLSRLTALAKLVRGRIDRTVKKRKKIICTDGSGPTGAGVLAVIDRNFQGFAKEVRFYLPSRTCTKPAFSHLFCRTKMAFFRSVAAVACLAILLPREKL